MVEVTERRTRRFIVYAFFRHGFCIGYRSGVEGGLPTSLLVCGARDRIIQIWFVMYKNDRIFLDCE